MHLEYKQHNIGSQKHGVPPNKQYTMSSHQDNEILLTIKKICTKCWVHDEFLKRLPCTEGQCKGQGTDWYYDLRLVLAW